MTLADDRLLRGGMLIGGKWLRDSGSTMDHVNPASGTVQAAFPVAGADEVGRAVDSARRALPGWRRTAIEQRRVLLQDTASRIRAASADFARACTLETGMPQMLAGMQAKLAADTFDYYAGWIDKLTGEVLPVDGAFNYTVAEPVGVVAALLTWNTPPASFALKVAPALAAGCTVVVKAPEQAPFSSLLMTDLLVAAGVPAGVVNVLTGGAETGRQLVAHPRIDKITFTGSPETAAAIQAACAPSITPMVLELGGKSANIVLADADLGAAAAASAFGVAALSGQICVAPTRLLVHRSVHDQLVEMVVGTLASLPVGDPSAPATFVGPVISSRARTRLVEMIAQAGADGAELVHGGEVPGGDLAAGFYLTPAVFTGVTNTNALAQLEAFGPLLAVTPFDDLDEAVALANDTRYGLAAYVHTKDVARAMHVAAQLDAGNVSVNGAPAVIAPVAPFGGFKDSGYGKEGGRAGLMEFVRIKNVTIATGMP